MAFNFGLNTNFLLGSPVSNQVRSPYGGMSGGITRSAPGPMNFQMSRPFGGQPEPVGSQTPSMMWGVGDRYNPAPPVRVPDIMGLLYPQNAAPINMSGLQGLLGLLGGWG